MVHFTRACKTLLSENNKTRLTCEKQQEKDKNIICRPWSVRIEKNCALGLEHGPRPAASGRTQDLWHSFSQYGPPGRQIIYMYDFHPGIKSSQFPLVALYLFTRQQIKIRYGYKSHWCELALVGQDSNSGMKTHTSIMSTWDECSFYIPFYFNHFVPK